MPKKLQFADEIGERYREIEYSGGTVLQQWRSSGGNLCIFHLKCTDAFLAFLLARWFLVLRNAR